MLDDIASYAVPVARCPARALSASLLGTTIECHDFDTYALFFTSAAPAIELATQIRLASAAWRISGSAVPSLVSLMGVRVHRGSIL